MADPTDDAPRRAPGTLFEYGTRNALAVVIVVALGLAAWTLSHVLLMAFAGLLIAILLRRGGSAIARHTPLPPRVGVLVVLILSIGAIYLAARTFGPRTGAELARIVEILPSSLQSVEAWLREQPWGRFLLDTLPAAGERDAGINIFGTIGGTLTTVFGIATSAVLLVSVAVFLALDPGLYRRGLLHLVPMSRRARAAEVLDALDRDLWRWLLGQLVDMAAVSLMTGVGLWLAGVPLPVTLGLIAGVLNFIPYVGPFLSAIPAVAIAFAHDPTTAIWALVVFVVVQQVEGNVLMPLIQKRAVALPPVLSILAIIAFGAMFGFIGVALATPLLLVVIVLVRMLYVEDVLGDHSVGAEGDDGGTETPEAHVRP